MMHILNCKKLSIKCMYSELIEIEKLFKFLYPNKTESLINFEDQQVQHPKIKVNKKRPKISSERMKKINNLQSFRSN